MTRHAQQTSWWRRAGAYTLYAWGMSLCYWGVRTTDLSFFRAGVDAYSRALRLWPQFAAGYHRRGVIRGRELGEHQAGIEDLGRAIAVAPEWPEPYLQRGLLRRFHGDPIGALEDLRQYLKLSGAGATWRAEAERQIAALEAETDHL